MKALRSLPSLLVMATLAWSSGCTKGVLPTGPSPVDQKTMTWVIKNSVNGVVSLRFFDRTTGAVWPSGTTSWSLDPGERRTYKLSCNEGSKICLGAGLSSDPSAFWGVGVDNRNGCEGCCHTCGSGDPVAMSLTTR